MPPAPSAPVHSPATATTPESWTGPKSAAEKAADELGYPVMIDGALCRMKAEALDRIKAGGETVKVSRADSIEAGDQGWLGQRRSRANVRRPRASANQTRA